MESPESTSSATPRRVAVIGAGPAGLTAALELVERGVATSVLEGNHIVGGISRTERYRGYRFDMGGHRFFTRSGEVAARWRALLGDDLLRRPRLSRIYYRRRFFAYPLKPLDALRGLGWWEGLCILASFLRWQALPHRREETFEHWVTNRFGARLFHTFFRAYTEKVWGIPCSELKADWAAQRIKDLSLRSVVASMLSRRSSNIRSLIEEFDYPRLGPGMMWEAAQARLERAGARVWLEAEVLCLRRSGNRITAMQIGDGGAGQWLAADAFVSSMPLTALAERLDPPAPAAVTDAAARLRYRSFLTVCLIVDAPDLFPDNWIYIQDPEVTVGRIQNFKNWSADMCPDAATSSLGMEYFCNEGDALWNRPDRELIELGARELEAIGLGRAADVIDGCVFRVPKSYPVYDADYAEQLAVLRAYVDGFENLQTIGRNGLHRYNNQDHAMLTGMLAVRNLLDGAEHDLWAVNADQEYHEQAVVEKAARVLRGELTRLDPAAFAAALGCVSAAMLGLLTLMPVVAGPGGPPLALLAQYFPGYSVSLAGAGLGALYAGLAGAVLGGIYAGLHNGLPRLWFRILERRFEVPFLRRLFDFVDRGRP
ncbi:MAG: FAD-dependent oxidoreductase [Salinisphaera sp.]|nr:FAD-dependent oxidoreductase [Salinisphaera sp.]